MKIADDNLNYIFTGSKVEYYSKNDDTKFKTVSKICQFDFGYLHLYFLYGYVHFSRSMEFRLHLLEIYE